MQAARDLAGVRASATSGRRHRWPPAQPRRWIRHGHRMVRDGIAWSTARWTTERPAGGVGARRGGARHDGPPTWFHGDLSYLNVLATGGRVSGIIDWGTCGVGDPAIDMILGVEPAAGRRP